MNKIYFFFKEATNSVYSRFILLFGLIYLIILFPILNYLIIKHKLLFYVFNIIIVILLIVCLIIILKEFIDYGKPVYITDEILKCMNIISKKTNNLIKFIPKNENKIAVKFIYDTDLSSEGIASLGKKNNDNFVKFKNVNNRVIIHELLHTLGLFHEFNRYDRDKFIKIEEILKGNNNTSTIKRPYILDYEYNLPYDIFSCMHYNYEYNFKLKDKYDENFIKILNIFLIYKLIFQPINSDKVLTDIDIEKIKFKYQ